MDGKAFQSYIEQVLAPELGRGRIVVMGNLYVHKSKRIEQLIEAVKHNTPIPAALPAKHKAHRSGLLEGDEHPEEGRGSDKRDSAGRFRQGPRRDHRRRHTRRSYIDCGYRLSFQSS
jgi:hypothetical protein